MQEKAKSDRIEIKIVLRADVLERIDRVANFLQTSRHALIEMVFSDKDHIVKIAYDAIQKSISND